MIHKEAIERIKTIDVPAEGWLNVFQHLIADAIDSQQDALDLCISFVEEGDEFVVGTYVPEIHLIVRRVDD
jgi:hypothetical protein